jgi:predicted transcriptional regulator
MCDKEPAMHFNIYLEDEIGLRLTEAARQTGENRNALIRRAVQEWLARDNQPQWPQAVLNFTGMPDMPAFETGREHLAAVRDDPLA